MLFQLPALLIPHWLPIMTAESHTMLAALIRPSQTLRQLTDFEKYAVSAFTICPSNKMLSSGVWRFCLSIGVLQKFLLLFTDWAFTDLSCHDV